MNFATLQYFIFISVVFGAYWHLRRKGQNILLLVASYFFYASWDWRLLSLIVISTLTNYMCGRRIAGARGVVHKRIWLILSLAISLGILGYFKYFHFFVESLTALAHAGGWYISPLVVKVILPVGISFYTFQAISYTIDIYRGELKPTRSLINFAAFVAFFPQLVAGPIVRAGEFIYQLESKRRFTGKKLQHGFSRFLFGFFKKAFVADTLGIYLVDPAFANPGDYTTATLWLAVIGWAIQIYADFSGYSSMAIGSAQMLGFEIPENFNFPYLSRNISQYWRRWHMTMSRFFRDYVYIGLGGNRHGLRRSLLNICITTFVSGLWHGAGWTFVAWGWLHGIYIAVFQIFREWRKRKGRYNRNPGFLSILPAWILTQSAISLSRILFRSPDFGTAWIYTKGLFGSAGAAIIDVPFLVWVAFGAIVIDHIAGWSMEHWPEIKLKIPIYVQVPVYAVVIIFLYHARPAAVNPYVYFQF
ncbi:MBOAT family O-acyltransferase [Candidatus Zixiibacteriota bacterium]